MSMDTVDDIEYAEDQLATLAERVKYALLNDGIGTTPLRAKDRKWLIETLGAYADYCRPTCGANGSPHDAELGVTPGYADTCGCPCHAR